MISAADALRLQTAQLTNDEITITEVIESAVEDHVRRFIERRGCEFEVKETNSNIIAELNQRFKTAGWNTQWQPLVEQHRLNKAHQTLIGWKLSLSPTDESYREAAKPVLS